MRGVYDFETYDWTKALCCGLLFGDTANFRFIHKNPKHSHNVTSGDSGATLAYRVLRQMAIDTVEHEIDEWWAHNGGAFDALLLLQEAVDNTWPVKGIPANGRLIVTEIVVPLGKGEVIVTLKDSYAVIQASLKKAAHDFAVGIGKEFGEEDYKGDMRKLPLEKLKRGNRADCLVLQRLLNTAENLFTAHGGKLKSTFSSSALSVLKASVKASGRKMPSIPPQLVHINELARQAYYGGRVEVFKHNPKGEVTEYDVLSSYPKAMLQDMPWSFMAETDDKNAFRTIDGFSHCRVEVPQMQIPSLPFRDSQGSLFFPTGNFSGWFPHNEIRYAESLGVIVRPMQSYLFTTERAPFADFVNDFYVDKMTAVGAKREFDKLCLNGAYGKFGQKPEKETLQIFPSEAMGVEFARKVAKDLADRRVREDDAYETRTVGSWRVLAVKSLKWNAHTHYPIASYITADARIRLHRILTASNAAYCDTDSVHHVGGRSVELDAMCGKWCGDLENKGNYSSAEYYAPKLYQVRVDGFRKGCKKDDGIEKYSCPQEQHWHRKSKGFTVDLVSFEKIVSGQAVAQERIRKAKSQLRKEEGMTRETIMKLWKGKSMKRKALPNGETRPWSVDEIIAKEPLKQVSPIWKGIAV